jgi:hypothetical protein
MKKINLGLDIHGTLDHNPDLFMKLITELKFLGYNVIVHIITGKAYSQEIGDKLICMHPEHKKWWDKYFSVQTYLLTYGYEHAMDKRTKRPIFNEETWNITKAIYCFQEKIDLHIDNEMKYLEHMQTHFILYRQNEDTLNFINRVISTIKMWKGVVDARF